MNIAEQIEQAELDVKIEHESYLIAKKDLQEAVKKWTTLIIERDFTSADEIEASDKKADEAFENMMQVSSFAFNPVIRSESK